MNSHEINLMEERRIYNVGARGGMQINQVANASINQRILDGIDLNGSTGGRRFDQHFDSQMSHDRLSIENYSSRPQLNQMGHGGMNDELRDSVQPLRRSETEFGNLLPEKKNKNNANHPLAHHSRQQSPGRTGVGHLDSIQESKSRSKSRQGGMDRYNSTHTTAAVKQKLGKSTTKKATQPSPRKGGLNDISQLTITSNRLEDSVKAPGRPPERVAGLTQFLVNEHYKRIGVFTKCDKQLFEFWKGYVSETYRSIKLAKSITGGMDRSMQLIVNDLDASNLARTKTQAPNFETQSNPHSVMAQYKFFGKLYEMDVAYTIQKDHEEEQDENKRNEQKKLFEMREQHEKVKTEKEEGMLRWIVEAYYTSVSEYLMANIEGLAKGKTTIEELMKRRHMYCAEKEVSPQEAEKKPSEEAEKKKEQRPQTAKPKDVSAEEEKKTPLKEIPTGYKPEEDIKFENSKKELTASITKSLKEEKEFMTNLFIMLRKMNTLTCDINGIIRIYKDQKEKASFGVIWAKGDVDASGVIERFFKPESVLLRVQILFADKQKKTSKNNYFSLFGFYLQMTEVQRQFFLVEQKKVKSDTLITAKVDHDSELKSQLHDIEKMFTIKGATFSMEEMCANYEKAVNIYKQQKLQEEVSKRQTKLTREREYLKVQVFGKDKKLKLEQTLASKKTEQRLGELAKPKDKWKRLRILMDLKKKFTHDITLEKMIKEELKDNRVFKYPEEYDLYDDQEDKLCKHMIDGKGLQVKELGAGKTLREKFKVLDDQELYYLKREVNSKRKTEKNLEEFLVNHALQYIQEKKNRLSGQRTTIRQFVSKVFHEMVEKFPEIAKERFPHITYGTNQDSETYKKSYPQTFKNYFFRMVKSYFKQQKGLKRIRNPAPTFLLAGGKRCLIHTDYPCPDDCKYATFNQKVVLRTLAFKKILKEPNTFRSRVWRRRDFKNALDKVLMLHSEQENCTFEPEAGSMSKAIDLAMKANPNLRKDGFIGEPDPEAYIQKLGKNFEKYHPEVYKAGVLKRAILRFKEGKFEDALKKLYEGFNVESIKKRFDPMYMRRFMAEALLKEKQKRLSKERANSQGASGNSSHGGGLGALQRIQALKDEPENQKKRPEEDFDNKKLIPILKEAFDLINTIEERKKITEKKIKKIERQQSRMRKTLRSFSVYKKSQTRLDVSKGEKILFRSIMCPLKDKCPKDMRPRWPTSNTKSITKFGEECPYAHHMMELKFPETVLTKLQSLNATIKNLRNKIDEEKPKEVFKPSGALQDCVGCNSKSSKHIGGPCNQCRYKEMANLQSSKFVDKKRMESLRRSLDKRESVEVKEEQKEMSQIMKLLDLDNNYTIKFGLLKKACVLSFYARFNDAFDEVAKAAKIIQDQREVERQKQYVIEKRWKFKLGLDEGFELPIPIDQIDPSKVDEKFLKKMDLQGVNVSTLKLYIEQVAPQGREEYSKHQFLNKCIEDFYLQCESMLEDKQNTITKMKKQVEKLDEEADMMEAFGQSPPERSPEKGGSKGGHHRSKSKKTKMCPNMQNNGKCTLPSHKCSYAHNPIELDLIPVETKMKNLQGVIQSQQQKLKNMKPLEPWRPVKSGEVIHTHLMDMSSKGRKKKGDDGDDEDDEKRLKEVKRKSIFDRENIFRKPYEVNE